MFVRKCDLCHEEIEQPISVDMSLKFRFDLCNYCATPILDYLRECEAIDENNDKIKEKD